VIATSESGLSVLDVVAIYKDLSDLEVCQPDCSSSASCCRGWQIG